MMRACSRCLCLLAYPDHRTLAEVLINIRVAQGERIAFSSCGIPTPRTEFYWKLSRHYLIAYQAVPEAICESLGIVSIRACLLEALSSKEQRSALWSCLKIEAPRQTIRSTADK